MPLEERVLGRFCEGPAGICDSVNDCDECISVNKEKAVRDLIIFLYSQKTYEVKPPTERVMTGCG